MKDREIIKHIKTIQQISEFKNADYLSELPESIGSKARKDSNYILNPATHNFYEIGSERRNISIKRGAEDSKNHFGRDENPRFDSKNLTHNATDSKNHKDLEPKSQDSKSYAKPDIYISCGDINGVGLELILRNHVLVSQICHPIYCVGSDVLQKAGEILGLEVPQDMDLYDVGAYELDSIDFDDFADKNIEITAGVATKQSGLYSFKSFRTAVELSAKHNAPLITLPINKYAWSLAGVQCAGHTQYLRERFEREAIMMLGCEKMQVVLFSDHVPLEFVPALVTRERLLGFLQRFWECYGFFAMGFNFAGGLLAKSGGAMGLDLKDVMQGLGHNKPNGDSKNLTHSTIDSKNYKDIESSLLESKLLDSKDFKNHLESKEKSSNTLKKEMLNPKMVLRLLDSKLSQDSIRPSLLKAPTKTATQIAVLGLNPHAGDNGVLGTQDFIIKECIETMNEKLRSQIFAGPIPPDIAFIPSNVARYHTFIAMYHDVGLAPLKALHFDKTINVSLNLPILRVSPDHGSGYDIAYKPHSSLSSQSYLECFRFLGLRV